MTNLIYKYDAYRIIGICMEVHRHLGPGFLEIVYKEALEYEFKRAGIEYEREKQFQVNYKDIIIPHRFHADFLVYDKMILEIKGVSKITEISIAQCINYLKVSDCKLALLINFGALKLEYQRIVY